MLHLAHLTSRRFAGVAGSRVVDSQAADSQVADSQVVDSQVTSLVMCPSLTLFKINYIITQN